MHRKLFPALLSLSILGGCASAPAPELKSLAAATAPSSATSLKTAALTYVSGDLLDEAPAPVYVSGNLRHSTPADRIEPLLFNLQDQADVTHALHANLTRLQVFKAVEFSSAPLSAPDLKITVVFAGTGYQPSLQQYTLNVTLHMQSRQARFRKDYGVESNPKASTFAAVFTSHQQAKAAAAQALLEQLLPDIQAFALEKA